MFFFLINNRIVFWSKEDLEQMATSWAVADQGESEKVWLRAGDDF